MINAQGSALHLLLIAEAPADTDVLHQFIASWPEHSRC
jgi:hypothetical protein